MNQPVDKNNYDVVSISQPGKSKRANYIQDALYIEKEKTSQAGQFVRIFSDLFRTREVSAKAYR